MGNIGNKIRMLLSFGLGVLLLHFKSIFQSAYRILKRCKAIILGAEFCQFTFFKILIDAFGKLFHISFVFGNQKAQNKNDNKQ